MYASTVDEKVGSRAHDKKLPVHGTYRIWLLMFLYITMNNEISHVIVHEYFQTCIHRNRALIWGKIDTASTHTHTMVGNWKANNRITKENEWEKRAFSTRCSRQRKHSCVQGFNKYNIWFVFIVRLSQLAAFIARLVQLTSHSMNGIVVKITIRQVNVRGLLNMHITSKGFRWMHGCVFYRDRHSEWKVQYRSLHCQNDMEKAFSAYKYMNTKTHHW